MASATLLGDRQPSVPALVEKDSEQKEELIMDDRAWLIKERIQVAYQYTENQRLAKEAKEARPARIVTLQRLVSTFRRRPTTTPDDAERPTTKSLVTVSRSQAEV